MKKMKINIKIFLVMILFIGIGSCTKDFEEMNVDPNNPVVAPATNLLAHSIRYFADNYYDDWMNMNNCAGYSGQIGKIQYIDEARYLYRGGVVNNAWYDAYSVIMDLEKAKGLALEEGATPNTNLKAACMTLQDYIWLIVTDTWKDIPYSQALAGEDGVTNAPYDSQEAVYAGLITDLKAAADLFAAGEGDLGEGDILNNGDVAKWQKFCNSLRLRIAIRISGVDNATATAIFTEVLGDPVKYPVLESNDDNVMLYWPGAAPYKEPWAENAETRDDHGMANTLIDYLKANHDPRLPVYAHPAASDGEYRGVVVGAENGSFVLADISRIGARFRDDAQGFTPFFRYAEVCFLKAEAYKLGLVTGDAQAAYEDGIKASLTENGITDEAYLLEPAVVWNDDITQIWYEKWVALFKQGHELWACTRRTDFPLMSAAPSSVYNGHNRPPFRYPYPTDEVNLNGANITPHMAGIVDHFWGQQMWWDTRTGVN